MGAGGASGEAGGGGGGGGEGRGPGGRPLIQYLPGSGPVGVICFCNFCSAISHI